MLFESNKCYLIQVNLLFESKKAFQTNYFLSFDQIFFLSERCNNRMWNFLFVRNIHPIKHLLTLTKTFCWINQNHWLNKLKYLFHLTKSCPNEQSLVESTENLVDFTE